MPVRKGEDHPCAKLSDADVELIRQLYESGLTDTPAERHRRQLGYKGIAKRFEIPVRTVRDIVHFRCRI